MTEWVCERKRSFKFQNLARMGNLKSSDQTNLAAVPLVAMAEAKTTGGDRRFPNHLQDQSGERALQGLWKPSIGPVIRNEKPDVPDVV